MHKHTAIVQTETYTHTQTQAVTQSCTQNASSQADGDSKWPTVGRVYVWGNRAECFVLTEKLAASQGQIHTDIK